jgi:hypothetical protein
MSIASPPEAPSASQTPPAPQTAAPPAPPYTTASGEPGSRQRQRRPGVLGGLILIALGVVALLDARLPGGASWLFLGLGAAFLLARVLTGRDGYAVPAGILLGFGSFIWFTETGILRGPDAGGLFFVFLGLGFLVTYAIVARPRAVWPLFPGMVLIGFGVFIQAAMFGAPIAQFWRLGQYWPLTRRRRRVDAVAQPDSHRCAYAGCRRRIECAHPRRFAGRRGRHRHRFESIRG